MPAPPEPSSAVPVVQRSLTAPTSARRRSQTRWTPRRAVLAFIAGGLLAVVCIVGVGYTIARKIATTEAIRDAKAIVAVDAKHVTPLLDDQLVKGDPKAIAAMDAVIRQRVLSDQVVRVKVWGPDGTIVYSDDHSLIGERYPLGSEEAEALRDGTVAADLSDLTKPENRDERQYGKLLEVYQGVSTRQGTPLLFECYLRFDKVTANGNRVLSSFAPALLGGVLALFLVQVPLAVGLTRRVTRSEQAQQRLLEQSIASSEQERRRIAADLHDSVVQGLAGSSYSLAALAEQADGDGDPTLAARLREHSAGLRQWVRELRTLIVSMVPPRLHDEGLAAALGDLGSSLAARGLEVRLDVAGELRLDDATEGLVYRAAQEATRNTIAHAEATTLSITVAPQSNGTVRLVVRDDGRGFDPEQLAARRAENHVGLQLLAEVVEQAGGSLTISSAPGAGTTVTLEVPIS